MYEIQKKHRLAKELYEKLLEEKDLPGDLKADIQKQLGWMYHTEESLGDNFERQKFALNYLESACKGEYNSRQSFYFLGRCYANLGQARLAFESYRGSVDKSETNADTWCSIGLVDRRLKLVF